ncbi:CPBP family intramembrane glutamic endopeptidase [Demequina sp. NBRC 110057]|uniref:CPBP family intramembrane glutamic endopeptidase n=1 Tax=Demequina sp. NBRC 110057 TaxID=1570346 RepID=UPI000A0354A4|nr:CPBP family intramembrane glutamic endopeptidase [Demequina sp. NBRC 110057]
MSSSPDAGTQPAAASAVATGPANPSPRRLKAEIGIVLGLSLGYYAITAALTLIERYLAEPAIGDQSTTLNPSRSSIDWVDLASQVVRQAYLLMPVALALYLLSMGGRSAHRRLGLTGGRHGLRRDALGALALAACIGIPGLALYAVSRALGQTVRIDTSGLPDAWWAATILLLSAAVAGVLEETIAVGYLVTRLKELRWSPYAAILASALLRGAYHLYQGWPMALGNVVMGLVFAYWFHRTGRLGPLILAHWTLDAVSFIGPEVVPAEWLDALGVS